VGLESLRKTKASRVLGIDCSTKSLAYAIFEDGKPIRCGEVFFEGADLYERLADAHLKIPAMVEAGILKADYICFESAYLGPNPKVGLSLAYVYGAVMGGLMDARMKVVTVGPITWQSYIGNPNLKKVEKDQLKLANPGKSASWYQNAGREMRKQRTLAFSRQFFAVESGSDNVGDAIAIAWYAVKNLVR